MFLYTIVPAEAIFDEDEITPAVPVYSNGRTVTVRQQSGGVGVVDQLLSTDPNDFLDPRWQPGTRVWMSGEV